jgi:universal stress protein E
MNILCATDFLPKSEAAIERAAFLADLLEAELTVVHAVAPATADGRTLEERLRSARARLAARTSIPQWRWRSGPDIAVQFGRPSRVVLDQCSRRNSRLVVVGPHRNSAIPDAVSGTITEKVLAAATSPLLIARREMRGPYREVLVALDDTPHSAHVVRAVESLHLTEERPATVIHAHESPYAGMMNTLGTGPDAAESYAASARAQAHAGIRDLLQTHSSDAERYEIMIVERRPASGILGTIERLQPDLVVLGTRARGRFSRALLGSVASNVVSAAQCDVLLVPDRTAGPRRDAHLRTPQNETISFDAADTGKARTGLPHYLKGNVPDMLRERTES